MDSTAIAMTMPPGRYGARHIDRWSVSVASCKATRQRHRACAVYRTFYLAIQFLKLAQKRHKTDPLLTSLKIQVSSKSRITARKLKSSANFLAIKRKQWTNIVEDTNPQRSYFIVNNRLSQFLFYNSSSLTIYFIRFNHPPARPLRKRVGTYDRADPQIPRRMSGKRHHHGGHI